MKINKNIFMRSILFSLFILLCLMVRGNIYDDNITITDTIYYESGKVKIIREYTDSPDEMYCRMYASDGRTLLAEGKYNNQQRDSVWNFYNHEGKLISSEPYLMGVKNGICKIYYENGKVSEITEWKNGVKDGIWKQYYDNGVLKSDGTYLNGKYDGDFNYYYINSKLSSSGKYSQNRRVGKWVYYNEDGTEIKNSTNKQLDLN